MLPGHHTLSPVGTPRAAGLVAATFLLLAAAWATAQPASVPAHHRHPKGFFLGVNLGAGGAEVEKDSGAVTLTDKRDDGFWAGYRVGFALSHSLALSLEGRHFNNTDTTGDWTLDGGFLALTWWPGGGGFFLRAGAGSGTTTTHHRMPGLPLTLTEKPDMGLVDLGYDWRLGRRTSLGLTLGVFGGEIDTPDGSKVNLGTGGLSVGLTYHL